MTVSATSTYNHLWRQLNDKLINGFCLVPPTETRLTHSAVDFHYKQYLLLTVLSHLVNGTMCRLANRCNVENRPKSHAMHCTGHHWSGWFLIDISSGNIDHLGRLDGNKGRHWRGFGVYFWVQGKHWEWGVGIDINSCLLCNVHLYDYYTTAYLLHIKMIPFITYPPLYFMPH